MSPIILVGAGVLLFGLGLGLGYGITRWRGKRDAVKASDIQNEMDDYRRRVSEHFGETAQHFEAIGQQYRSLYKHMAQGAGALCDTAQSDALLEFAGGDAAAVTTRATDEAEAPSDVIAEEVESPRVESGVESSDTSGTPESSSVPDDKTAQPPAEDVIADQVDTPTPAETDRTVH